MAKMDNFMIKTLIVQVFRIENTALQSESHSPGFGNYVLFGKVVLSVCAALRESFFCPRVVLGLSSFVLSVFLLSLQCCRDALVMS